MIRSPIRIRLVLLVVMNRMTGMTGADSKELFVLFSSAIESDRLNLKSARQSSIVKDSGSETPSGYEEKRIRYVE